MQASDVSILFNNAGVASYASVLNGPMDQITRDMETNYYGTLHMVRELPILESNEN